MTEINLISTIIQGGAVGISLVLIWVVYKLASNHINHNTEMLGKLDSTIQNNTHVIERLDDKVQK